MNAAAAETESATAPIGQDLTQVLAQLRESLQIIDALKVSPDIGALLQEVINRLADTAVERP